MSSPVLATKLFPPSRRETLVARPRLAQLLDASLTDHHHLTLVSAPAGFGKTTVLTAWLESLHRDHAGVATAWVSLDAGDNDLSRLLAHLAAALNAPTNGLDPAWADEATGDGTTAMAALANELESAGQIDPDRRWVVVFDDYHVIDTLAVHEAVTFLLDSLPRRVHVVIATRSDPLLPLARLRARGQLVELRAADLRFSTLEARDFLNRVMGLDLTEGDIEALEDRTEGWAAGLQLAALSLRSTTTRTETARFIDAFTGSNRFVIDYLLDEVLARLTPQEHDFLLRTSLLERLTGSLCDALTDTPGGAQKLERLERDNVFVVALDPDRIWFRYHHLFADVLQARLLTEHPDLVPTLHLQASQWYAHHDLAPEAVNHALAGGDTRRAAYLVEQALPQTRRARHDTTLLNWVAALPNEAVRTSPVLSILAGWSAMMSGDLEAMEARLDEAEAALALGETDPGVAAAWAPTEDLRAAPATVHVYRAALAQARGDVTEVLHHAQGALDLTGPDDHFIRGAAGGFLGLAAWADGDIDQALTTFTQAARDLRAAGNHVDALDASIVIGSMWLTAGRPSQARLTYEQALAAATMKGEPQPRATPDLHVGLAELDLEGNDLDAAQAHLDTARTLSERSSITENRYRWYAVNARLQAARGEHADAVELLHEAQDLYVPGAYPDLRPIPAMRARLHIAAGNLYEARQWVREHDVSLDDEANFRREYNLLTLVRLHLADSPSPVELTRVLATLDRLQAAADRGRAASAMEIGVLRALTLNAMGHGDAAATELNRALSSAPEADQYLRLFIDEGTPMEVLVEAASTAPEQHPAVAALAQKLEQAAMASREGAERVEANTAPTQGLVDPLSDRELEVLRLLNSELTGPEIASHMFVSLNTLRTHTKRIFTKLSVRNRAAAVRRGRELGLLEKLSRPSRWRRQRPQSAFRSMQSRGLAGAAMSHRQSPVVVTRGHLIASYRQGIPGGKGPRNRPQEQDMTITPRTLVRVSATAAAAAGAIFIGVQVGHPHLDADTVTTTQVAVRDTLKVVMAVLSVVGITGMYLSQVRRNGVLGLIGYITFAAGYLTVMATSFVAAFVLPAIATTNRNYTQSVLDAATGGTASTDIGALEVLIQLQGVLYLAGGLLFGIALFRAAVLPRWASALLTVSGLVTAALSIMPDALYRLLAYPNGIALIALGYGLWRSTTDADLNSTSAAGQLTAHDEPATTHNQVGVGRP